jgi:hypothetical protein
VVEKGDDERRYRHDQGGNRHRQARNGGLKSGKELLYACSRNWSIGAVSPPRAGRRATAVGAR